MFIGQKNEIPAIHINNWSNLNELFCVYSFQKYVRKGNSKNLTQFNVLFAFFRQYCLNNESDVHKNKYKGLELYISVRHLINIYVWHDVLHKLF